VLTHPEAAQAPVPPVTISKQKQTNALLKKIFQYRSETNQFILNFMRMKQKRSEPILNFLRSKWNEWLRRKTKTKKNCAYLFIESKRRKTNLFVPKL
jgi:hypothetical protein